MITVRIPKEIRDYKEKIALGLSFRQLVCTFLALVICVPLYVFGRKFLGEELISWIVIIIAFPLVAIGYITYNNMTFEKYLVNAFKFYFLYPSKRKYKINNVFEELEKLYDEEYLVKLTEKQRKEREIERTYRLMMAIENGEDINLNDYSIKTYKEEEESSNNIEEKDTTENKDYRNPYKEKAEKIKQKRVDNPTYLYTKKENEILKSYAKYEQNKKNEISNEEKKKVLDRINEMMKRKKVKSNLPKDTQSTLPYVADYDEGLIEVEKNVYSKTIEIMDINYQVAKQEEQEKILLKYFEFLNYFSEEQTVVISILNKKRSLEQLDQDILIPLKEDGGEYDEHRKEYNRILKRQQMNGRNDIQQTKYITITVHAENPYEAYLKFAKLENDCLSNLKKMGSNGRILSTEERLTILHDICRKGEEGNLVLNYEDIKKQGLSTKDYIAPSSFDFKSNYFMIDDTYYKCVYVNNLPSALSDDFYSDIVDVNFEMIATFSIKPIAQQKAVRMVKKQITGMESDKMKQESKLMASGYNPDTINHSLRHAHKEGLSLLEDITEKDQKMFYTSLVLMVSGTTKKELDSNVDVIKGKVRKATCQIQTLNIQQEDSFKQALPMGLTPLQVNRTLTTESTGIFIPFTSQELMQPNGWYYGINQLSRNLILLDRTKMKTPSGFVLGTSGSGKSFAVKRELLNVLLCDDKAQIIIIDPDNEYEDFCKAFKGTSIDISAESSQHINPMDLSLNYSAEDNADPLIMKSEYIMSLVECMLSVGNSETVVTPQQKSVVDRSLKRAYDNYISSNFNEEYIPTLKELQDEFNKEKKTQDGRMVAEGAEYYTTGSMNMFSHKSNVEYDNRLVAFNIKKIGNQIKNMALLITLDFIWNKLCENKDKGIRTYIYVDESHLLFKHSYSANFLQQLYKRCRKYGGCITCITQNIEDVLKSEQARGMIANSQYLLLLAQQTEDVKVLSQMLNLSEQQKGFISGAEEGSGLLLAEKTIVPFIDRFPQDSYLYKFMTTKFGE